MNNPNHPLYNALGGNSNIHLLDNMLFSAEQHKPGLIPQYAAYPMDSLAAHQVQHAMNLAVSGQSHMAAAVAATTIDSSALLYQQNDHHQQQPISYKIPQVSSVLIQQHHHQQQQQQQQHQHQQQQALVTAMATVSSLQEKKKDIVAQAMREEKIFEEISQRQEIIAKKTPATITISTSMPANLSAASPVPVTSVVSVSSDQAHSSPIQNKPDHSQHQSQLLQSHHQSSGGESNSSTPKPSEDRTPDANKPSTSAAAMGSVNVTPRTFMSSGRGRGSSAGRPPQRQQQMMPRLQLMEDEDDGLTCRMCLQPFWYKSQLHDHLKSTHSISDPERYEREEREKKLRRQREEQQRIALAKQQKLAASNAALRGITPNRGMPLSGGRGRGVTIGMSRGGVSPSTPLRGSPALRGRIVAPPSRPSPAGPRPSFQYRGGAFICDLCKKSFSDGNDMVAHWKLHVKQQQQQLKKPDGSTPDKPEKPPKTPKVLPDGTPRGRGRPAGSGRKTHATASGRPITGKQAGKAARKAAGKQRADRKDKGKPKWTAYLLWSSRRRKEIAADQKEMSFAEVGKAISEGWREVGKDELDKLKDEAEALNATGIKSTLKDASSAALDSGEENWSEADDPSFEKARSKSKSKKKTTLKIKVKKPPPPSESRSGRKRKRPSFFQEFEDEENNLDKILDDFEQEQLEEAKNPRPKAKRAEKTPRAAGGSKSGPRARKHTREQEEDVQQTIELETTRSGRVRKKTKFFHFVDEDDDDDSSKEDRDECRPDSDVDLEDPEEVKLKRGKRASIALPPKKRGRQSGGGRSSYKSGMSQEEIKRATKAALAAKPVIISIEKKSKETPSTFKKPSWMIDEDEGPSETTNDHEDDGHDSSDETKPNLTLPKSFDDDRTADPDNTLEGSVTEEDPPENMFGEDDEDEEAAVTEEASADQKSEEQVDESQPAEEEDEQQQEQQEEHEEPEETTETANQEEEDDPFNVMPDENAEVRDAPPEGMEDEDESIPVHQDEDLLNSETTDMEAGDEQYKNLIAESQMDNIFN